MKEEKSSARRTVSQFLRLARCHQYALLQIMYTDFPFPRKKSRILDKTHYVWRKVVSVPGRWALIKLAECKNTRPVSWGFFASSVGGWNLKLNKIMEKRNIIRLLQRRLQVKPCSLIAFCHSSFSVQPTFARDCIVHPANVPTLAWLPADTVTFSWECAASMGLENWSSHRIVQKTAVKAILQQRNTVGIYCKSAITQRNYHLWRTSSRMWWSWCFEMPILAFLKQTLVNKLWLCILL